MIFDGDAFPDRERIDERSSCDSLIVKAAYRACHANRPLVCRLAQPEEPDFNLLRNSATEIVGGSFATTCTDPTYRLLLARFHPACELFLQGIGVVADEALQRSKVRGYLLRKQCGREDLCMTSFCLCRLLRRLIGWFGRVVPRLTEPRQGLTL